MKNVLRSLTIAISAYAVASSAAPAVIGEPSDDALAATMASAADAAGLTETSGEEAELVTAMLAGAEAVASTEALEWAPGTAPAKPVSDDEAFLAMHCTPDRYTVAPFCLPAPGAWWVKDHSYVISWDPAAFPNTEHLTLALVYGSNSTVSESLKAPVFAVHDSKVSNTKGVHAFKVDGKWLKGKGEQNVFVVAMLEDHVEGEELRIHRGPSFTLKKGLPKKPKTPPPKINHDDPSLKIAVPVVAILIIGFLILVVLSTRGVRTLPDFTKKQKRDRKGKGKGQYKPLADDDYEMVASHDDLMKRYKD
ncbi:hypothetical protein YB2330_003143 [Saitoella coloradoensis]